MSGTMEEALVMLSDKYDDIDDVLNDRVRFGIEFVVSDIIDTKICYNRKDMIELFGPESVECMTLTDSFNRLTASQKEKMVITKVGEHSRHWVVLGNKIIYRSI